MARKRTKNKNQMMTDLLSHVPDEELPIYITTSLTTPSEIDKYVSQFCKRLSPKETCVFLDVQPQNWSRLNYCNKNVDKMKELYGGSMILGYKIWYVPSLYIEAERHAVWLSPENELVDITFNKDGETKILFVPAPQLTTVSARAETKPREGFHPRIVEFIKFQIWTEKMKSQISIIDDTWDGWERSVSFESWSQNKKNK